MNPYDVVLIDGIAQNGTEEGQRYTNLKVMIATVFDDGTLKVWPMDDNDPQLSPDISRRGKLVFSPDKIEKVVVLESEETS